MTKVHLLGGAELRIQQFVVDGHCPKLILNDCNLLVLLNLNAKRRYSVYRTHLPRREYHQPVGVAVARPSGRLPFALSPSVPKETPSAVPPRRCPYMAILISSTCLHDGLASFVTCSLQPHKLAPAKRDSCLPPVCALLVPRTHPVPMVQCVCCTIPWKRFSSKSLDKPRAGAQPMLLGVIGWHNTRPPDDAVVIRWTGLQSTTLFSCLLTHCSATPWAVAASCHIVCTGLASSGGPCAPQLHHSSDPSVTCGIEQGPRDH